MLAPLMADSPLLVALGSPFGGIGSVWFSVLVGLALVKLGTKRSMVVIPHRLRGEVRRAVRTGAHGRRAGPFGGARAVFRVHDCIVLAHSPASAPHDHRHSRKRFANRAGRDEPLVVPAVLQPRVRVRLPVQRRMRVCVRKPRADDAASCHAAVVRPGRRGVLHRGGCARRLVADALYRVSALLVFAGFLLVPLSFNGLDRPAGFHMSSMLLYAGSDCFSVLTYYLIAAVGSRNPAGALSTSAFAIAAGWLGIGCGALLVQSIEALGALDGSTLLWSSAIVTFLFMTYNFVAMRGFSFEDAIKGVRPAHPTPARAAADEAGEDPDTSQLEESCENVIRRFGLTPREGDVLRLLARGRTSPVIQEKLFLSHNTVKTHVRHIYAKMDIHSQQELIDIVEGADA